ncbi:hypothetical protein [Aquimarina pacifica]|uniref:hypothetical protein n=1 Tax=Aquimarina pacifica TaxID=1296415 RepID=UPI0004BB6C79|nr:hypothetical protein [Aquimarina pacifica]
MKTTAFLFRLTCLLMVFGTAILFTNCEKEHLSEEEYILEQESEIVSNELTKDEYLTKIQKDSLREKGFDFPIDFDWCSYVPNLSGYYYGNDGGHYYFRQIGNQLYWFGEHPSGFWSNVFKGTISGKTITGTFYDVPKGGIQGQGSLTLYIGCFGLTISKTSGNQFGGSLWTKTSKPANLPLPRSAGFGTVNDENDITGRWIGDDGGVYYIREYGNMVVWFGERFFISGQPSWSNIAWGSRFYSQLWLDWADVPKGSANSSGILRGFVEGPDYITLGHNTGGFGGTRLWRY